MADPFIINEPPVRIELWLSLGVGASGHTWAVVTCASGPAAKTTDRGELELKRRRDVAGVEPLRRESSSADAEEGRPRRTPARLSGERLFDRLLRSSSEGIILTRLDDGLILEASDAFTELVGYERDELIGRRSTDLLLLPPDVRERTIASLKERGFTRGMELDIRTKTGEIRQVEFSSDLLEDAGHIYALTTIRDVSERKRAHDELRRSRDRFETILEANPVPTAVTRLSDGKILYANRAMAHALGWQRDDLVGRSTAEIDLWADPSNRPKMVERLARDGRIYGMEERLRRRNGEVFNVITSIEVMELDGERCLLGLFYDISERVRAEEALRLSQAQLWAFLDSFPSPASLVDRDGRVLLANTTCASLFGDAPDEIVGRPYWEILAPAEAEEWWAKVRAVIETKRPTVDEFTPPEVSGEARSMLTVRFPVVLDGEVVAAGSWATDITERRRLERELREAKEEAERASRAKSEFVSRMSHELRTPLNAILGFSQLLALDHLSPDQQEAVTHITDAGRHLLQLVNEVLDLSRIETGGMVLSIESVRLAGVVAEATSMLAPLAAAEGVSLVHDVADAEDLHVRADQQRLKQVLLNLISNAIKYNREGGAVRVRCQIAGDSKVRLSVDDTGLGIAERDLEQVFVPFERFGPAASTVEGAGLGLALSKRLVELMDGGIGVQSTPGEGSSFWVELATAEAAAERPAAAGSEVPARPPDGRRRTVLYVEDNLANVKLVERVLARRPDVELVVAMQATMALDLARQYRPNLVLLDLHLPDMGGEDVLRRLRDDAGTTEIPVVVVSGDATAGRAARLRELGADGYLTKPFDIGRLLAVIDGHAPAGGEAEGVIPHDRGPND